MASDSGRNSWCPQFSAQPSGTFRLLDRICRFLQALETSFVKLGAPMRSEGDVALEISSTLNTVVLCQSGLFAVQGLVFEGGAYGRTKIM